MIRKLFIAAAMLTASGVALAHGGQVYGDQPSFAFSVGTGPYSGFSMSYSSSPYWGPVVYGPAPVVVAPPPYYRVYAAPPGHAYKHRHRHGGGGHDGHGNSRHHRD
jgi:hypothetical protein